MASKIHCDLCDTVPAVDTIDERATIHVGGIRHQVRLLASTRKAFGDGSFDDEAKRAELCAGCRRKVLLRVLGLPEDLVQS